MTDAEIEELETELRLHKEERLRLRGIETRLTLELNKARELLREAWTQLAAGAQPYSDESMDERVKLLKQMSDIMQPPKRVQAKCYCGKDSVYYGFCSECSKKLVCHD